MATEEILLPICSESKDYFEYLSGKSHNAKLMENVLENFYEGQFCDIELLVGSHADSIMAHRVILASSCDYFKGLLKTHLMESQQTSIKCLEHLKLTAVSKLVEYCYSGKILLKATDIGIEHLLEAADYLRLQDVCQAIASFLQNSIGEQNCLGILQIADHYNLDELRQYTLQYAARNFAQVTQEDEFTSVPLSLLEEIIQSDHLIVHIDKLVLPSAEHEGFIVSSLLKYLKTCKTDEASDGRVAEILRKLKLPLLNEEQVKKLRKDEMLCKWPECLKVLDAALVTMPTSATDDKSMPWSRARKDEVLLREFREFSCGGEVNPVIGRFDCRDILRKNTDVFVTGMGVGIRRWDGREVLGGLKVTYSNGKTLKHGLDLGLCESSFNFNLGSKERIVKVEVNSGWMIDRLKFFTNLGNSHGPYGGDGGSSHIEEPMQDSFGYLAGVSGSVISSQGLQGITRLKFMWGIHYFSARDPNGILETNPALKEKLMDPSSLLIFFKIPYSFHENSTEIVRREMLVGDISAGCTEADFDGIMGPKVDTYLFEAPRNKYSVYHFRKFSPLTFPYQPIYGCFQKYDDNLDPR